MELDDAIHNIMEVDGWGNAITYGINQFIHTEDIVISYIRKYPHLAPELYDTMELVKPYDLLLKYSQRAQDDHARELLQRIVDGENLALPTRLEKLVMLIKVCQTTTAKSRIYLLTVSLARDILSEPIDKIINETGMQESYTGQLDKVDDEVTTYMTSKLPRYKPDRNCWYDRVSLEKKHEVMKGVRAPEHLMVPALYERQSPTKQLPLFNQEEN